MVTLSINYVHYSITYMILYSVHKNLIYKYIYIYYIVIFHNLNKFYCIICVHALFLAKAL